jgi:AhpD family alkylhydroperoxidase
VALVRLVDPQEADPSVAPTLDSGRQQYGTVLNTWRALLHRPPIFDAYLPYLRAIMGPGVLDQRLKDLVALTVALTNHCRYSASHRVRSAQSAGVTDDELDALAEGRIEAFSPLEQLAISVARELSLAPPRVGHQRSPQALDRSLLDQLGADFDDAQIVELIGVISLWNALTRFHRVMDLPLDMPPPPESIDRALSGDPAQPATASRT